MPRVTRFQIKVCGVTSVEDALAVARAGADAIGLNFFPGSPRWIDRETASEIIAALPADLVKTGVFVNEPIVRVCALFDELGLDLIQLHGDEPPEAIADVGGRPVMRAFRCGEEGLEPALAYLQRCRDLRRLPELVLLDAFRPGHYGGTGNTLNWMKAIDYRQHPDLPPLVLAGGLRPETVAEAIAIVRPAAVDTASGVESSPGKKDPRRVEAFVQAARRALEQTGRQPSGG